MPAVEVTAESEDSLELLADLAQAKPATPKDFGDAKLPRATQVKNVNRPNRRLKETISWITGGVAVVLVLVIVFVLMSRKTWARQNRQQIMSMMSDAKSLLQSGQPKVA